MENKEDDKFVFVVLLVEIDTESSKHSRTNVLGVFDTLEKAQEEKKNHSKMVEKYSDPDSGDYDSDLEIYICIDKIKMNTGSTILERDFRETVTSHYKK